jgi:hypothetical protein
MRTQPARRVSCSRSKMPFVHSWIPCSLCLGTLLCLNSTDGASLQSSSLLALMPKDSSLKAKDKAVVIKRLREEIHVLEKQLTNLERSVVLLQVNLNVTKIQTIESISDQGETTVSNGNFNIDTPNEFNPPPGYSGDAAYKTPSWVDALGESPVMFDQDIAAPVKKSGVHKELDPSLIDSDQSWLDAEAQSPAPSPPNECTAPTFREGGIVPNLPGSGGDRGADADLSYVTPRDRSPPAADAAAAGGEDGEALLEDEAVSRVTSVGRADMSWRFQRTMSMSDIVVPEPPQREKARKPVEELVFFLDLDKCAIYGKAPADSLPFNCDVFLDGHDGLSRVEMDSCFH